MSNVLELKDYFQIQLEKKFHDLSKSDKIKLIDSLTDTKDSQKPKGLLITMELSSSGKRINNRIYSPIGQYSNVDSWTSPYKKPIIRNHDINEDPIGRFSQVRYKERPGISKFFRDGNELNTLRELMDRGNAKKAIRMMDKLGLLTNKYWPGFGLLLADVKIVDPLAIEKFLDERYLTFSAGSSTDSYKCGTCNSDWAQGDICEHRPGMIDEESGLLNTFLIGAFKGKEASVVGSPANDTSYVLEIKTIDSDTNDKLTVVDKLSEFDLTLNDSTTNLGDIMTVKDIADVSAALSAMDARDIAKLAFEGKLATEQLDALEAGTHFETSVLIRVHDALHMQYDWELKWKGDGEELAIPLDVFKLHGAIHELSMEKDFRGSMVNGQLDHFDLAGKPSELYVIKHEDSEEAMKLTDKELEELTQKITSSVIDKLKEENEVTNVEDDAEEVVEQESQDQEEAGEEEGQQVLDIDAVVQKLDTVISLLSDKSEDLPSSEDSESSDENVSTDESDEGLVKDLESALKRIQDLEEQIASMPLDTKDDTEENTVILDNRVDNPGVGDQDPTKVQGELTSYEKSVLKSYDRIAKSQSKEIADQYLDRQKAKGYISKDFEIPTNVSKETN